MKSSKVAIVADWLTNYGGAESVIESFSRAFPDSPIFTTVFVPEEMKGLGKHKNVHTSFLQKLPKFIRSKQRLLLSLLPRAVETFDLTNFDVVLSSSSFVGKGVLTNPETLHICYCHTPARFLWDNPSEYLKNFPLPFFIKAFLPSIFSRLRVWDRISAERVDAYIANSDFTSKKIAKMWRKKSEVIAPPVDTGRFNIVEHRRHEGFYLWVGRLVAQKNIELLIETFREMPEKRLVLAGTGNIEKRLKKMASGAGNIEFLGFVPDEDLPDLFRRARATLFPQIEDAGIVPLESLASGTPVIAYRKGGALTTLNEDVCEFFDHQSSGSLKYAIGKFEKKRFEKKKLHEHAMQFSRDNFEKTIKDLVLKKWAEFQKKQI